MSTIRVDRITPYQSGSVAIESLSISNLAIDGTITASIQEGFVLVGGSGNVSTLAATSSFGGGDSTDITALNSFTASQQDLNVTLATTGSNVFIGTQTISGSILVSGSINSDGYELGAPSTSQENTAYWFNTDFTLNGGITFQFSEGNSIANIDNLFINETSSNTNGETIVNSLSWITGLVIGDVITIQGVSGIPSNLTQTIVLSVNSITDFLDGTWNIGVSVLSSTPVAAPVNGSLYSLTYTTTTSGELYTISADTNELLISSSNTRFSGDITASVISGSFVGDGSGLIGVPSTLDTGSFAVTGSNTFVGNQQISGSLIVTGSIVSTTVGVYRANLFDQGEYINPTELENSTGRTFSWIASGTGFYRVTISGASIHQSKIIMRVSQTYSNNSGDLFNFVETRNPNQPEIRTKRYDTSTSTFIQTQVSDGGSNYFSVEILIYP